EIGARAWIELIHAAIMQPNLARAATYVPRAKAAVARVGTPPRLHDHLVRQIAFLDLGESRPEASLSALRGLLAEQETRLGPDDPELVQTLADLARTDGFMGLRDEVLAHRRRVQAILDRTLGPDHPRSLQHESALGESVADAGNLEEGERLLRA